jgi:hypothetical protein
VKVYAAVPSELVDGWRKSVRRLSGEQVIDFHYHDVEEWLTIVSGEITFFTLADDPVQVDVGHALHIPHGKVHRAEVGSEGVEYQMLLPTAVPTFVNELTAGEFDVLKRNLEFPEYEDGRAGNGHDFFESILSDKLVFCRASGECVDKGTFIAEAFVDKRRSSSGSIQVLSKTEKGLLISTVVEMVAARVFSIVVPLDGAGDAVDIAFGVEGSAFTSRGAELEPDNGCPFIVCNTRCRAQTTRNRV